LCEIARLQSAPFTATEWVEKYRKRAAPIICPYECMNGSMGSATIARAIRELEEKGFIERTRGGLMKQPNLFAFSGEWINWHEKQNAISVMKAE